MKTNVFTVLSACLMVLISVGALFFAMSFYEQDNFTENWTLTPAIIEKEINPLYGEEFDANSTEY